MSPKPRPVVLITGASSGIGHATALALAARGWIVYGAARRVDRMQELEAAGCQVIEMDVTDDASLRAGVDRIIREQRRVDVLVNNAGYGSYGALEDVPIDEAGRQFEVNVFGLARLSQLVIPTMRALGRGRIINVSSIGGLSDSLRIELAPHGIDVVIIQPGPIRTEWNSISRRSAEEYSGAGPYAAQARALVRNYERVDDSPASGAPEDVAAIIVRAATARRPKTRYATPASAKIVVAARRLLPDRIMDLILRRLAM